MIVEIEGLQKIYDGKQRVVAVDGIDLSVREGELFGLARTEWRRQDDNDQHLHDAGVANRRTGTYRRD